MALEKVNLGEVLSEFIDMLIQIEKETTS